MDEIQIFKNDEFGEIRTILVNNEPCFVGKDVATVLGYTNPRKAIIDHVDEEDKNDGVTIRDSIGRLQKPTIINESGLYSLILSSKLPTAKKFKKWVTSEVLPAIRKTGSYTLPKSPWQIVTDALSVAQNQLAIYHDQLDQARLMADDNYKLYKTQKEENTKLLPDANYTRETLTSKSTWNTNVVAKEFGMSAVTFNKKLEGLGIQYKQHGVWLLSSEYQDKGYTKSRTYNYVNSNGEVCSRLQTEWTEKGRRFLHELHDKKKF